MKANKVAGTFSVTWHGLSTRHRVATPYAYGQATLCGMTHVPPYDDRTEEGVDWSGDSKPACKHCEREAEGARLYGMRNGRREVLA